MFFQVCSSLEGLSTEAADMTAVLAVSLSAVTSQCIGILAHLITVETLISVISIHLELFPTLISGNSISIVCCSICGLGLVANQYDLLACGPWLSS